MDSSDVKFEIGHVLFIDIVGYSKLLINEQSDQIQKLKAIVRGTEQVRLAEAEGKLLRLPTGDGGALVFRNTPEAPAMCALEISKELKSHPELRVRMGVHSGPVNEITDLNEQANIAGAGINIAQRVMDCADAGHILISKHVADDLEQYPRWRPLLHDLGECKVKHGVRLGLVNLYGDELGNPDVPQKLQVLEKRTRARWTATATAVLLLAGIVAAFVIVSKKSTSTVLEKSIAVLPFENRSEDKANAYFADGIQDEILTRLSKIADLKVISRTSTQHYKSAPENLPEIARQLGVAHIVEGSVQKSGDAVRVNVQLIKAANDSHLWADTFDRKLTDIFSVESEVAKAIADQLQAVLSSRERTEIAEKPTSNIAAYDLFLRALEISRSSTRSLPEAEKEQIRLLEQATMLDPAFVPALCALARTHLQAYWFNHDHTANRLEQGKKVLEAAARLQPDAGEVHFARALFYYRGSWDYLRALEELRLARRDLPNDPFVLLYISAIERRVGHWEESTGYLEESLKIDPQNGSTLRELANNYSMSRHYADAARVLEAGLRLNPNDFNFERASLERDHRADLRPMQSALLADSVKMADHDTVAWYRMFLALDERDFPAAGRALSDFKGRDFPDGTFIIPREIYEASVERGLGDETRARSSYLAARERVAATLAEQPEEPRVLIVLALIDAYLGRNEEAVAEGKHAAELLPITKDSFDGPMLLTYLAAIYVKVKQPGPALDLLERVAPMPRGPFYGDLKLGLDWDPLRNDPRFEKLVASLAPKDASASAK